MTRLTQDSDSTSILGFLLRVQENPRNLPATEKSGKPTLGGPDGGRKGRVFFRLGLPKDRDDFLTSRLHSPIIKPNAVFTAIVFTACACAVLPLHAADPVVANVVSAQRAYVSADTVSGSLRQAIANAAAGETVDFDAGLSGGTIVLGGDLLVNKAVLVDADALGSGVTVDAGAGNNRIFDVVGGGALTLEGVTLIGGNVSGTRGGAIYGQSGSSVTLRRCTLTGNNALEGGAIFTFVPLLVENSTLTGNTGGYGGAVQCLGTPSTITHSTIAENSASFGGGIYNKNTTLTLANSIVAGIRNENASLIYAGGNLAQSVSSDAGSSVSGPGALATAPLLAPLGDYGGPAARRRRWHCGPAPRPSTPRARSRPISVALTGWALPTSAPTNPAMPSATASGPPR